MGAELFQNMSKEVAQQLLAEFIADGKANIEIVIAHANHAGVECDYLVDSLPAFLHWAFSEMKTVPREPDPDVSDWIRSTEDYQKGLFDFDDRSKNLICFAAYYLGECFTRTYPKLKWGTGHEELHQANMPVITGFGPEEELPPMLVIENVFRRATKRPERSGGIDTAVETWKNKAEST